MMITTLLVLEAISGSEPPGPNPTTDPHLTTPDAKPPIDIGKPSSSPKYN